MPGKLFLPQPLISALSYSLKVGVENRIGASRSAPARLHVAPPGPRRIRHPPAPRSPEIRLSQSPIASSNQPYQAVSVSRCRIAATDVVKARPDRSGARRVGQRRQPLRLHLVLIHQIAGQPAQAGLRRRGQSVAGSAAPTAAPTCPPRPAPASRDCSRRRPAPPHLARQATTDSTACHSARLEIASEDRGSPASASAPMVITTASGAKARAKGSTAPSTISEQTRCHSCRAGTGRLQAVPPAAILRRAR